MEYKDAVAAAELARAAHTGAEMLLEQARAEYAEAQTLGREAITMALGSPERRAKLRRFQEIVNGDIGLVPLFTQFDNLVMREHVQGYVYYPDAVPVLAKLSLG